MAGGLIVAAEDDDWFVFGVGARVDVVEEFLGLGEMVGSGAEVAAEHGEVKAQSNLGALYATGRGVPQNYPEAAKWYGLAAKRGDASAGTILERIRSAQAGQSAQSQRLEARGAGLPSLGRLEPAMFRFSSPTLEQRTIHVGPAPSAGFHMMTAHHFGRR